MQHFASVDRVYFVMGKVQDALRSILHTFYIRESDGLFHIVISISIRNKHLKCQDIGVNYVFLRKYEFHHRLKWRILKLPLMVNSLK